MTNSLDILFGLERLIQPDGGSIFFFAHLSASCERLAASPRPVRADCRSPKERFRYGERHRAPPLRPPVVPAARARAHVCIAFASRVATGRTGPTVAQESRPRDGTRHGLWQRCSALLPHGRCHAIARQPVPVAMYTGHCTRRPADFRTGSVAAVVCFAFR